MKTQRTFQLFKSLRTVLSLVCLVAIVPEAGFSQQVHASAGDHLVTNTHQLSQTIGEPVISTHAGDSNVLTQGMQQSKLTVLNIENTLVDYQIKVFPNPTQDLLFIDIAQPDPNLDILMFDAMGNLVSVTSATSQRVSIDLSGEAAGVYILSIVSSANKQQRDTFRVIKAD